MKRIFFILLVLASCAAIAYMFWKGPEPTSEQKNLLQFVPEDAYMILEVPSAEKLDQRINGGLLIWEELQLFPAFAETDSLIHQLANAIGKEAFALSRHPSGALKSDWLLTLEPYTAPEQWRGFFAAQGYTKGEEVSYNGEEFSTFSKEGKTYFVRVSEQVIQCSLSKLLLEKASRVKAKGIMKLPGFQRILKTKAATALAFLYMNHESTPIWSKEYIKPDQLPRESLGGWSLSDVELSTNALRAVGLIQVSDSADHHLAKYAPYRAVSLEEVLEYLPDNTVAFTMKGQSAPNKAETDALELDMGSGQVIAKMLGSSSPFVLYPLNDGATALDALNMAAVKESEFRGLDFYRANTNSFDAQLMQEAGLSNQISVAVLKNMAIIAADGNSLKELLDRILTQRNLRNDVNFQSLLDDVSSSSAYHLYLNLSRSVNYLDEMFLEGIKPQILNDDDLLEKFQALIIQYEPSGPGLFHMNTFLKYNPEFKKETSSVWETALDTSLAWGPTLVKNHYSGLMEILVQDAAHRLYLISNTGKVLWKKNLPGSIRSDVQQVDILKNGKLQMLFNTDSAIHLLDRNGETVTGFPIELHAEASSPVTVLDYENNRKYRFLIGTADGKLSNYNGQGKEVDGWEFEALIDDQVRGVQFHFTIGNKDYITCMTEKGEVMFLERSGRLRQKASSVTAGYEGGPYGVIKGKSITDTRVRYAAINGELRELTVGGGDRELETSLKDIQPGTGGRWIALRDNQVMVFDEHEGITQHDSEMDSVSAQALDKHILLWDPGLNTVRLLDDHFNLMSGFPLIGSGPGAFHDINGDGSLDLILRDGAGSISMFSLQ